MAVDREAARRELARRELARRQKPEQYNVTDDMNGVDRVLSGIGGGMVEGARKATNLVLPDSLTPEWASDEAINEQARMDAPLEATTGGSVGKMIGQTALTAPIGAGVGAGALRAATALRGARAAAGVAPRLAGALGRSAVEGGVEGAILARPGEGLEGAALGAGLSGGLTGAARGLGAIGRKMKIDKMPEASALEAKMKGSVLHEGDEFIPISQSGAKDSLGRMLYNNVLANFPGVGGKLRKQYERALGSFRETAIDEVLPVDPATGLKKNLAQVFQSGDDIQRSFSSVDDAFDEAFKVPRGLKSVRVPQSWFVRFGVDPNSNELSGAAALLSQQGGRLPSGKSIPVNGRMDGTQAMELRQAIQDLINDKGMKGTIRRSAKNQLIKLKDDLDTAIYNTLKSRSNLTSRQVGEAEHFKYNLQQFGKWDQLRNAAKAGDGTFSPEKLLNASTKKTGKRGFHGEGGPLQDMGKLGKASLEKFNSNGGIYQALAAATVLGGSFAGAKTDDNAAQGALWGGLAPYLLARGMIRPGTQKLLMGEKQIPQLLRDYATWARRGIVANATDDNGEE